MITIILLHPQNSTAIQSWTFKDESIIRIGRATDNHVVLYSAVVSRHHLELQQVNKNWQIINLGTNGTFLDDEPLCKTVPLLDGVILRLARSGPKLQVWLGAVPLQQKQIQNTT